jgi:glucose/arabinose dehydrogenase
LNLTSSSAGLACALLLAGAASAASNIPLTGTYNGVPTMPLRNSSGFPEPRRVEGQPVETRTPEKASDAPDFPGQTRAPYRATPGFRATVVARGLELPYCLAFLPDGQMLVTEKKGALRLVSTSGVVSQPISGVPKVNYGGQPGLLDVAVDKDYARNHRIFLSYSELVGTDQANLVVASAKLDERAGALSELKVVFRALPLLPKTLSGIQGGRMAVDPKDGSLFITVGDHSKSPPWRIAQDLSSHLGKIVHIMPDGRPHPANPFLRTKGALPEIWSLGHRSEQGLAFDPEGRLWETEHGAKGGDELNLVKRGSNYGWPLVSHGIDYPGFAFHEGRTSGPGLEPPRYYWDPVIAPSGLAFYRGGLFPAWKGSAFIGGLRSEQLLRVKVSGGRVVEEEPLLSAMKTKVREVRVGPDGAVYFLTDKGELSKLVPG